MDDDLDDLSHDALLLAAKEMRAAIRAHRDSTGHNLCWHHPQMWSLLPDTSELEPIVPEWPVFLRGCIAYRTSLDEQLAGAERTSDPYGEPGDGAEGTR